MLLYIYYIWDHFSTFFIRNKLAFVNYFVTDFTKLLQIGTDLSVKGMILSLRSLTYMCTYKNIYSSSR